MTGRPVQLLTAAALAAAASLMSISAASAGCYNCGPSVSYAPVVTYQAPVVYSQSYAAPVAYARPCGCATQAPMYVVNQGPTYGAAVTIDAEPTPAYEGYDRAYPYYGADGMRWHRRHWHNRHHGYGYGYGYRHHGYRSGAFAPGYRQSWRPRHAMVGPGGMYRGGMQRMHGPRFAYGPRPRFDMPHRAQRMHMMREPGVVHPQMGGPRGPMHGKR